MLCGSFFSLFFFPLRARSSNYLLYALFYTYALAIARVLFNDVDHAAFFVVYANDCIKKLGCLPWYRTGVNACVAQQWWTWFDIWSWCCRRKNNLLTCRPAHVCPSRFNWLPILCRSCCTILSHTVVSTRYCYLCTMHNTLPVVERILLFIILRSLITCQNSTIHEKIFRSSFLITLLTHTFSLNSPFGQVLTRDCIGSRTRATSI